MQREEIRLTKYTARCSMESSTIHKVQLKKIKRTKRNTALTKHGPILATSKIDHSEFCSYQK